MHLMMINAYEFGQFLRILLWICVPIAMGVLLITKVGLALSSE